MDEFNPLDAPDLDNAQEIEAKDMKPKRFAHMDYIRNSDGKYLLLFRPTDNSPVYFIPITSLESQYEKDLQAIHDSIIKTHFEIFIGVDADELITAE